MKVLEQRRLIRLLWVCLLFAPYEIVGSHGWTNRLVNS